MGRWWWALLLVACGGSDDDNTFDFAVAISDAGATVDQSLPRDGIDSCTYPTSGELVANVGAPATELSGLIASRRTPARFWANNDSGDSARIYAFDLSGAIRSVVKITDADGKLRDAVDWEDIAWATHAGVPYVYVSDAGDNAARDSNGVMGRSEIYVHRFPEPDPDAGDGSVVSERLVFKYPGRPYDCEAMFIDPVDGTIYFVTKQMALPAPIFRASPPFVADQPRTLEQVGGLDYELVTAADVSSDGNRIAVRGYLDIRVVQRQSGQSVADALKGPHVTVASDAFAESLAFSANGYDLYTAPEGVSPPLYREACH